MNKILVVGAGGIGSWLGYFLFGLEKATQLGPCRIQFSDDDMVDLKNIRYQNFVKEDILEYKVAVLGDRYGFEQSTDRIVRPEQLDGWDIIISCVDNVGFRKMLFTYCGDKEKPYWIDLRSEGRAIAFYTKHAKNTLAVLIDSLPADDDNEGGSCQLAFELEAGIIQQGNKIIACIGSQLLLNHLRGEANIAQYTVRL